MLEMDEEWQRESRTGRTKDPGGRRPAVAGEVKNGKSLVEGSMAGVISSHPWTMDHGSELIKRDQGSAALEKYQNLSVTLLVTPPLLVSLRSG